MLLCLQHPSRAGLFGRLRLICNTLMRFLFPASFSRALLLGSKDLRSCTNHSDSSYQASASDPCIPFSYTNCILMFHAIVIQFVEMILRLYLWSKVAPWADDLPRPATLSAVIAHFLLRYGSGASTELQPPREG
ncbi:hypothetical protein BDM02DRAFT_2349042 [Thelephora ganbajun]|uniref:Uncharacterized protein n=1 Tax=Thelephora ganbajun TaxID=370292 RepID=A0ACB6YZ00_THEGA|nr:hypothetical protein BDM02DRAFT_2349042 [Thelephora ganbajun]